MKRLEQLTMWTFFIAAMLIFAIGVPFYMLTDNVIVIRVGSIVYFGAFSLLGVWMVGRAIFKP